MSTPTELYTLNDAGFELRAEGGEKVLVLAIDGHVDAGEGKRLTAAHLLDTLDNREVATFDIDALYDYRGRRPHITLQGDHFENFRAPRLAVHALEDASGQTFLLMYGAEPDFAWERFIEAVTELIADFSISKVVSLTAAPMPVPHTRPHTVTAHANRPELVDSYPVYWQDLQIPASVDAVMELRLGEIGIDAMGFAVHVPHYLASSAYPDAALTLIDHLTAVTGLSIPTDQLRSASDDAKEQISVQVAESAEIKAMVTSLEENYDSYLEARATSPLLTARGALPDGDELGAELERFLAEQSGPDPKD